MVDSSATASVVAVRWVRHGRIRTGALPWLDLLVLHCSRISKYIYSVGEAMCFLGPRRLRKLRTASIWLVRDRGVGRSIDLDFFPYALEFWRSCFMGDFSYSAPPFLAFALGWHTQLDPITVGLMCTVVSILFHGNTIQRWPPCLQPIPQPPPPLHTWSTGRHLLCRVVVANAEAWWRGGMHPYA